MSSIIRKTPQEPVKKHDFSIELGLQRQIKLIVKWKEGREEEAHSWAICQSQQRLYMAWFFFFFWFLESKLGISLLLPVVELLMKHIYHLQNTNLSVFFMGNPCSVHWNFNHFTFRLKLTWSYLSGVFCQYWSEISSLSVCIQRRRVTVLLPR